MNDYAWKNNEVNQVLTPAQFNQESCLIKASFAPIIIFAYRRSEHLKRTLQSLKQCKEFADSPVIVFVDGPRDIADQNDVNATRDIAQKTLGATARYVFRETNMGLARSVIAGVNEIISQYGRVIVVEDDLCVSPKFLEFMNQALDRYAVDDSVFQISGYMYGNPELESQTTALFLPFIGSWGWATWQRAWRTFDPEATGWQCLRTDSAARRRFNLDDSYEYATMLFRQMTERRQSWAIRWYWSVFKANGLVLYPPVSLVKNIGLDGTGTHGKGRLRRFAMDSPELEIEFDIDFPDKVEIHHVAFNYVKNILRLQNGRWIARVVDKMRWWKVVVTSHYKALITSM